MSHLPKAEIAIQRGAARSEILAGTAEYPRRTWYALMCPCNIDWGHMPHDEVPRIKLSTFLYRNWIFSSHNNRFGMAISLKFGGIVRNFNFMNNFNIK